MLFHINESAKKFSIKIGEYAARITIRVQRLRNICSQYFYFSSHLSKVIAVLCIIAMALIETFYSNIGAKNTIFSITTSVLASALFHLFVFEIPKVNRLRSLYRYINNLIVSLNVHLDSFVFAISGKRVEICDETISRLCYSTNPNTSFNYQNGSDIKKFSNYTEMTEYFTGRINSITLELLSVNDLLCPDIIALVSMVKDCATERLNMHSIRLQNTDLRFAVNELNELHRYTNAMFKIWREVYGKRLFHESRWIPERLGVR